MSHIYVPMYTSCYMHILNMRRCTYTVYVYVCVHSVMVSQLNSLKVTMTYVHTVILWNIYLNQKHPGYKKRSGQELKKGLDKKDVKSKWAAKACVVLLLMEIKF